MRKIRKLSFLGILGVVIAVLFLIGISFMQAQVQIKGKPGSPPGLDKKESKEEATWAVRIPTQTEATNNGLVFYGVGDGYYEDSDQNVVVSVEKNSPGAWRRYFNFVYSFDFTLTNENVGSGNPPAYQVGFQNVPVLDYVEYPDDDKLCCQFPPYPCQDCFSDTCGASCMADFLTNEHPYSGVTGEEDYQYFWFRVNFFDHDIESMAIGESYLLGGNRDDPDDPGDYLSIVARYRQECFPPPIYHDVELYRNINSARAIVSGNPMNIMIERLDLDAINYGIECDGVWRIWVLPNDYQGLEGFLKVQERYCTIEKNKTKWYYPMVAKGNFNFYIDFIKNPTTN